MLNDKYDVDMIFENKLLSMVVCLQEVCVMWGKSPRQVHYAIDNGHIEARKSFTGGTWLIVYYSVCEHWGEPVKPITGWMVKDV